MSELENDVLSDDDGPAAFAAITAKTPVEAEPAIAETPAPAETPAAPAESPMIPHARFQEVNQRSQQLQRELDQARELLLRMAPKPEPVAAKQPTDLFENPNAFVQEQMSPHLSRMEQIQYYNARLVADQIHGADKVKAAIDAYDAAEDAGQVDEPTRNKVRNHPNPFIAALEWERQTALLREVGTDPDAYKARIRADLMKDPDFRSELLASMRNGAPRIPGATTAPAVRTLPSTARVGANAITEGDEPDDETDFKNITKAKRRR